MPNVDISPWFDPAVEAVLAYVVDSTSSVFDFLTALFNAAFHGIVYWLSLPPSWVFALAMALLGWRVVGRIFGTFALLGLLLCDAMGFWPETLETLALVAVSTFFAMIIALPIGVITGMISRLSKPVETFLDFVQTVPAYLYLLPGVAILGYGPATAVFATTLVALAPPLRLTAHGVRITPNEYIELSKATGMTAMQALWKVRLPYARPTIMAGINQCVMTAFGMVVIAGIVGSGGLGEAVYKAVQKLNIARSLDAGIAIVILTVILDRIFQKLGAAKRGESVA